ncbi:hypothetical protein [Neopusillimonas aromaticivorans]|uniref:hypothetical protein n=1 Tax=Neopusillimonas aromaticivorans TaxID=2979868 RepID=UPI00331645E9
MKSSLYAPMSVLQTLVAILAMAVVVVGSNILVQYPINQWLTWGPSRIRSPFWWLI